MKLAVSRQVAVQGSICTQQRSLKTSSASLGAAGAPQSQPGHFLLRRSACATSPMCAWILSITLCTAATVRSDSCSSVCCAGAHSASVSDSFKNGRLRCKHHAASCSVLAIPSPSSENVLLRERSAGQEATTHPLAKEALLHDVPAAEAVLYTPNALHLGQLALLAHLGIHRPANTIVSSRQQTHGGLARLA